MYTILIYYTQASWFTIMCIHNLAIYTIVIAARINDVCAHLISDLKRWTYMHDLWYHSKSGSQSETTVQYTEAWCEKEKNVSSAHNIFRTMLSEVLFFLEGNPSNISTKLEFIINRWRNTNVAKLVVHLLFPHQPHVKCASSLEATQRCWRTFFII